MKNYPGIILILLFLLFASVSCEDLFGLLTFDSKEYTLEFVVNPSYDAGYNIFKEEVLQSNLDSILDANDVSEERLKEVHIKEAVALITNPDTTVFFDPLASFSVTIYTDSLGETIIAEMNPVPDGLRELSLPLKDDDLKNYLLESDFMLSAVGVLSEQTSKPIPVRVKVKFEFKAGLN
jgi:hypothetical protein